MPWSPAFPAARDEFTDQAVTDAETSYREWMEHLCDAHPGLAREIHERSMIGARPVDRPSSPEGTLSRRQVCGLRGAAYGLSTAATGIVYGVERNTAKTWQEQAKRRLDVRTVAGAVAAAIRSGELTELCFL